MHMEALRLLAVRRAAEEEETILLKTDSFYSINRMDKIENKSTNLNECLPSLDAELSDPKLRLLKWTKWLNNCKSSQNGRERQKVARISSTSL